MAVTLPTTDTATVATGARARRGSLLGLIGEFMLTVALVVATAMMVLSPDGPPSANAGAALDRRHLQLAFDEQFDRAPSYWDALTNPHGRWKTNYWFGVQQTLAEKGWEPRTLAPNEEMQYYGDPKIGMSAFEWRRGVLSIAARPNPFVMNPATHGLPYLSGLITTEKSFAQTYGYFEARIAYPSQKGLWPAFWLLPVPRAQGGQLQSPGTTEIDVFESIGEPGKLYFTYYPELANNQKNGNGMALDTGLDLSAFHTYGVLVTPKVIAWYLDDREVRRVENKDYHKPLYMLLNLAVGGKWPGAPGPDTRWPARMRIDWVRAYRLTGR
jgi:beta-glucanase (GH16 family)